MITNIFLDFDGVIVDSNEIKTLAFLNIYKKYDKDIKLKIKNHHEENGGMSRYKKFKFYNETYLNIKITKKEINRMSIEFTKFVFSKILKKKIMPGLIKFIKKNKKKYSFYIISATPQNELRKICKEKKIFNLFNNIYGSPEEKNKIIKKIIFKNKLKKKNCLFIGDSINDLEAANKTKINFLGFGNIFKANKLNKIKYILKFNELESFLKNYEY